MKYIVGLAYQSGVSTLQKIRCQVEYSCACRLFHFAIFIYVLWKTKLHTLTNCLAYLIGASTAAKRERQYQVRSNSILPKQIFFDNQLENFLCLIKSCAKKLPALHHQMPEDSETILLMQ